MDEINHNLPPTLWQAGEQFLDPLSLVADPAKLQSGGASPASIVIERVAKAPFEGNLWSKKDEQCCSLVSEGNHCTDGSFLCIKM